MHEAVIKLKLECRLHEYIIKEARKLQIKPDARMERELDELREKGADIAEDIFNFVQERDKHDWRAWEKESDPRILKIIRQNYKMGLLGGPTEAEGGPSIRTLEQLILKLINEVNFIEDKLDRVEIDKHVYEQINRKMKDLFSKAFTHQTWIFWETKAKRARIKREAEKMQKDLKKAADDIAPDSDT